MDQSQDQEVTVARCGPTGKPPQKQMDRKVRELVGRNLGRLERAPIGAVKASVCAYEAAP